MSHAIVKPHRATFGVAALRVARDREKIRVRAERPTYDGTLARAYATGVVRDLRLSYPAANVAIAGSLRRGHATVHDIDILLALPLGVPFNVSGLGPYTADVIGMSPQRVTLETPEGCHADVRIVPMASWGSALQYYTGSREHNVWLRSLARSRGLSLSEYGFRHITPEGLGVIMPVAHESEVYKVLGLRWLPPRYREHPNGGKSHA